MIAMKRARKRVSRRAFRSKKPKRAAKKKLTGKQVRKARFIKKKLIKARYRPKTAKLVRTRPKKAYATSTAVQRMCEQFLIEVAGPEALDLTKMLRKPATDADLAERMGVKVTVVRAALNKLYDYGVTTYNRQKDAKTGWYTYTWSFVPAVIPKALRDKKVETLTSLRTAISKAAGEEVYACDTQCELVPFELAIESMFRCKRCGNPLNRFDNAARIKALRERAAQAESDLKLLRF